MKGPYDQDIVTPSSNDHRYLPGVLDLVISQAEAVQGCIYSSYLGMAGSYQ